MNTCHNLKKNIIYNSTMLTYQILRPTFSGNKFKRKTITMKMNVDIKANESFATKK